MADTHDPTPAQFAPAPASTAELPRNLPVDKSSRWTPRDDIMLADALIVQKNLGKSRDVVFTADAWTAIAAHMKGSELVSGGAQKSVTQCKARWQRLKIEYRIVKHLRAQPGFTWDEQMQMVTASVPDWDAYIAEHRDAQPWRKKSFPAYDKVAYLVEDENGQDAGDEQFRRRWNSQTQNHADASAAASEGVAYTQPPGTGVFSISAPSGSGMPIVAPGPGISISVPFNGNGTLQQYQVSIPHVNGKRRQPSNDENQIASTKRSKSTTSPLTSRFNGFAVASSPQTFSPPAIPAPVPATRLATAIQTVEDTEGLSDDDFVKIVQLFQRRSEAADAYLAIQSKRARSLYLREELGEFVHLLSS